MSKINEQQALEANIKVHSKLADTGEYNRSPHFLPENQQRVRAIIERLVARLPEHSRSKIIDFGCGTGFVINLIHDLFEEVHGVDITTAMMSQVDTSPGNIFLHEGRAESTDFEDNSFNFATAYSFMDHLFDSRPFLEEAHRVLKPGGIFYSDLNPNRDFIMAIASAREFSRFGKTPSEIVEREIIGATNNGQLYQDQYGIDAETLEAAEPGKTVDKGFNAEEIADIASEIGFSESHVEFEWFLGQAAVTHQQSEGHAQIISQYLDSALPGSRALYKYLRFVFVK